MMDVRRRLMMAGGDRRTYLYNQGDLCTDLTGWWDKDDVITTSGISGVYNFAMSDYFYLTVLEQGWFPVKSTSYQIDVTNYSKLRMEYFVNNITSWSTGNFMRFGLYTSKYVVKSTSVKTGLKTSTSYVDIMSNSARLRTAEINLSSITGTGYVMVYVSRASGSMTVQPDLKIYKIWLEP